jgi:hypothetical protein
MLLQDNQSTCAATSVNVSRNNSDNLQCFQKPVRKPHPDRMPSCGDINMRFSGGGAASSGLRLTSGGSQMKLDEGGDYQSRRSSGQSDNSGGQAY